MNKHPEPLFKKRNFPPPGMINFMNIFITPPKTFQFDLGVAGKEILTLSALYRSCQFLPLSDQTNMLLVIFHIKFCSWGGFIICEVLDLNPPPPLGRAFGATWRNHYFKLATPLHRWPRNQWFLPQILHIFPLQLPETCHVFFQSFVALWSENSRAKFV